MYLRFQLASVVLALSFAVSLGSADTGRAILKPIDEGPLRPDFLQFRSQLQRTVARRDVSALLQIVHPTIKNSFGGGDGIEGFKERWELDNLDTEVWRELGSVLSLGGTFEDQDTFVAPYVFSRWPDDFDAFEYVALVGSGVRVRSAPSPEAPVIATQSFAILRLEGDSYSRHSPWTFVVVPDGRRGYVSTDLVRSPVGYRAFFERIDGRWQMTVFIAGD
jgi:hypothetical protein